MTLPTVLVVDDDADFRRAISARIASEGMVPVMARGGADALTLFEQLQPAAIVLDANMPDVSGPEACKQFREARGGRTTCIVFVSGASAPSPDYVRRCAEVAGGDYFFAKPVDHAQLLEVLRSAVRQASAERRRAGDTPHPAPAP
jgi:CheY-like chemotaxis protein